MRVVIPAGNAETGKRVSLEEAEIHHLRVRRAREHETIEVLDGAGLRGTGSLVQVGRDWMVDITAAEVTPRPPELTLAVAAGDRQRFSLMVEKAVELGVTSILPLESARTTGVASRVQEAHIDRLRRSALESTKQCGALWAPKVASPVPLLSFLEQPPTGTGWLADEHGDATPARLDQSPITVIIGPEGGLTNDEREAAVLAGYRPVALGTHTLRFETAALAAAVAVTQARMRGQHD
jgi:16S rRNA (uracil1498-N3)-methyltransferase